MPDRKQPNDQKQRQSRIQEQLNNQAEAIESLQAAEQDNAQPIASVQRNKME